MKLLKLNLTTPFYDADSTKLHCSKFLASSEAAHVVIIDPTDDDAWEKLTLALRESLGKAIHRENS